MLGLNVADTIRRQRAALTQVWRAPVYVMGVGCQNMDVSLVEHPFAPVSRISAKSARKAATIFSRSVVGVAGAAVAPAEAGRGDLPAGLRAGLRAMAKLLHELRDV